MAMNLSDYYFNTQKEHEKSKILLKVNFDFVSLSFFYFDWQVKFFFSI